ncbi:hypothetical protein, partial [Rhizobium favelukesii]
VQNREVEDLVRRGGGEGLEHGFSFGLRSSADMLFAARLGAFRLQFTLAEAVVLAANFIALRTNGAFARVAKPSRSVSKLFR